MAEKLPAKTYTALILGDDKTSGTGIGVPFDPEPVFGRNRVPVVVTVNGYTFRSTIAHMGASDPRMAGEACTWVPLRKSRREAIGGVGVKAGDKVKVTLTLDTEERTVEIPKDLTTALKQAAMLDTFEQMSFTHRREYAEAVTGAKKPDTRGRRIEGCVTAMKERAKDRAAKEKAKAATKKTTSRAKRPK